MTDGPDSHVSRGISHDAAAGAGAAAAASGGAVAVAAAATFCCCCCCWTGFDSEGVFDVGGWRFSAL